MSFARDLSIAKELTGEISQEVRKLGIVIDQGVVIKTPVRDGFAKASWLVGIGSAPTAVDAGQDLTGASTVQRNNSVIGNYPTNALPDLWIVNNRPYMVRLNNGWSEQVGAFYIEEVIDRAVLNGR
jgi:hypothetical protein